MRPFLSQAQKYFRLCKKLKGFCMNKFAPTLLAAFLSTTVAVAGERQDNPEYAGQVDDYLAQHCPAPIQEPFSTEAAKCALEGLKVYGDIAKNIEGVISEDSFSFYAEKTYKHANTRLNQLQRPLIRWLQGGYSQKL